MSHMNDTEGSHGRSLVAYLDALRETAGATSMRSYMASVGYDAARVSQWKLGKPPSIAHMRELADALDVPLGEILVAAMYGTADDFGGIREVRHSTVLEAIRLDTQLSDKAKAALSSTYEAVVAAPDAAWKARDPRSRRAKQGKPSTSP